MIMNQISSVGDVTANVSTTKTEALVETVT